MQRILPPSDWVVIGQERWDDVLRRNQLILAELARRHPRARFLFCEEPLRARRVARWRVPRARRVAANIWVLRPIRPLPGSTLAPLSDRIEAAQIRLALRTLGVDAPTLWSQDPRAAALLDHLPTAGLVYDLTDDWPAFERDPARRARVQRDVDALVRRADLVLACSRPLEQAAAAISDRMAYVPNAIDDEALVAGDPDALAAPGPTDVAVLARPRAGYVGTLHSQRVDVELLARTAELLPQWSFVLVGPDHLDDRDRDRLARLGNVHNLGVRPHRAVPAYLRELDVALLPHVVSEFTRSLDPLKLYEYLAAGLPIVATPTGNTPDLQEHIATAATAPEMAREIERALARNSAAQVAARRAAVAGATWAARVDDIEAALACIRQGGQLPGPSHGDGAGRDGDGDGQAPAVTAVVASYNTRELLARCLAALREQSDDTLEIIVVDNASHDGSAELVRADFPEVHLIELDENAGFARANNIAIARARGQHILLINSDAFMHPGALRELTGAARRNPRAAVIGPRLYNADGTLQRSAWPFPAAWRIALEALALHRPLRQLGLLEDLGTWAHDREREVDFLVGACLLVRHDALLEIGGFDEAFWMYGEEADAQRRLAARGWTTLFTPAAGVTHLGAASSRSALPRLRRFYAGQRRFLHKHGHWWSWPVARLALLCGSLPRRRWDAVRVALEGGWEGGKPGVADADRRGRPPRAQ